MCDHHRARGSLIDVAEVEARLVRLAEALAELDLAGGLTGGLAGGIAGRADPVTPEAKPAARKPPP